jgi:hypothetical protein
VAALLGRGRVGHRDPVGHGLEVCPAHPGQAGMGSMPLACIGLGAGPS